MGDPMPEPMAPTGAPIIVVLGRDWCDDTIRSRAWMDAHGVAYEYRNVEVDPAADGLIRSYNGGAVVTPTILLAPAATPAATVDSAPTRVLVEPSDDALAAAIGEVAGAA